jgi:hypothetical protein
VWSEIECHLGLSNLWIQDSIEECFAVWFINRELKQLRVLPYLVLWGIWLACNSSLFEDKYVPSFRTVAQCLGLLSFYKIPSVNKPLRIVGEPRIDKSFPWSFFDSACNDSLSGCGFILHLTDHNYFHFMENVGRGTNNFNEFMALFLLLKFAHRHRIDSLQVFGDSSLVINCLSGSVQLHNIVLRPLFDQLRDVSSLFTRLISHMYSER